MPRSTKASVNLPVVLGSVAVVSALVFGVGGWMVANGIMSGASATIESAGAVVDDVAIAADAASVSVSSMREVVDDIEDAARSGGRTLATVEQLLTEIGEQAAGDVADSLESAVAAMPGIIRTGRVIDRTLIALSLLGVDYDPAVPLDEALEDLRGSLSPLPGKIREQARLLDEASADLGDIAESSGNLAASLLEIRIELPQAEGIVANAAIDVQGVSNQFDILGRDFDDYRSWVPWLILFAAISLAAIGAGLVALGLNPPDRLSDSS